MHVACSTVAHGVTVVHKKNLPESQCSAREENLTESHLAPRGNQMASHLKRTQGVSNTITRSTQENLMQIIFRTVYCLSFYFTSFNSSHFRVKNLFELYGHIFTRGNCQKNVSNFFVIYMFDMLRVAFCTKIHFHAR